MPTNRRASTTEPPKLWKLRVRSTLVMAGIGAMAWSLGQIRSGYFLDLDGLTRLSIGCTLFIGAAMTMDGGLRFVGRDLKGVFKKAFVDEPFSLDA